MEQFFSFGEWVRRRRKALDLTQEELAQQVQCATVTVRKIESDVLRPSREIADRLAKCLAIPEESRNLFLRVARAERAVDHLQPPVELPQAESPAPAVSSNPTNLPASFTSFIGREDALAELNALVSASRLVTLTGVGGVGKTRLALQVAGEVLHCFPDGAWLIELAPLSDPRFIAQAVASALTIREAAGDLLLTTLCAALRDKRLLLILDNCEHLLAGSADFADALLRACPQLHILATSREPLNLLGEQLYPIQPLAAPGTRQASTIEELASIEAVALFCERARTRIPTFRLTAENMPAVAELCRRLDGLPLAIELAAAHIRLRSPQALLEHSPLATLIGGPRNLPSRQQTLRTTIDWSYQLLDRQEQHLFTCLGVFAGGWTAEAAAVICSTLADPDPAVVARLDGLFTKNLLTLVEDAPGQPRFLMLDTIRAYALERLIASGQADMLRERHGAYYLALAERAEEQLSGPRARVLLDSLEQEHENLRAVLSWTLEAPGESDARLELAFRLCVALWRFWWMRGFLQEGRYWLDRVLAAPGSVGPRLRAKVLRGNGVLARSQGATVIATAYLTESLALLKAQGDKPGIANVLNSLGIMYFNQRDFARAQTFFQESSSLYREMKDIQHVALTLNNLGNIAQKQADLSRASELYEEALALLQGSAHNEQFIALITTNLGEVARLNTNYAQAVELICAGGATYIEINEVEGIVYCLNNLADIASAQSHWALAAQLLGAADALYEHTGVARSPSQTIEYEQQLMTLGNHLGEDILERNRYEGRSTTIQQLFHRILTTVAE